MNQPKFTLEEMRLLILVVTEMRVNPSNTLLSEEENAVLLGIEQKLDDALMAGPKQ